MGKEMLEPKDLPAGSPILWFHRDIKKEGHERRKKDQKVSDSSRNAGN